MCNESKETKTKRHSKIVRKKYNSSFINVMSIVTAFYISLLYISITLLLSRYHYLFLFKLKIYDTAGVNVQNKSTNLRWIREMMLKVRIDPASPQVAVKRVSTVVKLVTRKTTVCHSPLYFNGSGNVPLTYHIHQII